MKIIVDSSVWIEYFKGGQVARKVDKYFKPPNKIILPSIVTYEVYKKIKTAKNERVAILILAQMERLSDSTISTDQSLAVQAADLSIQFRIPMADALIYSVALSQDAAVVTMDAHFKDLPNVQFIE